MAKTAVGAPLVDEVARLVEQNQQLLLLDQTAHELELAHYLSDRFNYPLGLTPAQVRCPQPLSAAAVSTPGRPPARLCFCASHSSLLCTWGVAGAAAAAVAATAAVAVLLWGAATGTAAAAAASADSFPI